MSQDRETTVQIIPKDLLELIPRFDGDQNILNLFIKKCEYILRNFNGPSNPVQQTYLFHCLTSRLCGRAAALISEHDEISTWESLKPLLIQHFGDPRSEECVAIELENLKIKQGETYLQFCNRIQQTRSALCSKVNLLTDANLKAAKIIIYNNLCLNVFLYNLPEDLLRIVRLKNCSTLEDALSVVMEEVNFQFQYNAKNKNKLNTSKPNSYSANFGNNQSLEFRTLPAFKPNFVPSNFATNQQFKPAMPYQMPSNFKPGFKFGIPNQGFSRPGFSQAPGNFKFGIPNQRGFTPNVGNPQNNFKFGIPQQGQPRPFPQFNAQHQSNQQFKFGIPPQQQQFKFGIPPQYQSQRNPPHFQESDASMRTVRPVKQNMLTHVPQTENNDVYLQDYSDLEYVEPQGLECPPDYALYNYEANTYYTDENNCVVENLDLMTCGPENSEENLNFPVPASKTNHQK